MTLGRGAVSSITVLLKSGEDVTRECVCFGTRSGGFLAASVLFLEVFPRRQFNRVFTDLRGRASPSLCSMSFFEVVANGTGGSLGAGEVIPRLCRTGGGLEQISGEDRSFGSSGGSSCCGKRVSLTKGLPREASGDKLPSSLPGLHNGEEGSGESGATDDSSAWVVRDGITTLSVNGGLSPAVGFGWKIGQQKFHPRPHEHRKTGAPCRSAAENPRRQCQ